MGKKLSAAFPGAGVQRHVVHQRLKSVQRLRNRISHHERILTSRERIYTGDGLMTLAEVVECVDWACPHASEWIRTRFRFSEAQSILKRVRSTGVRL